MEQWSNASNIRWSVAANKLEHGRPRCNLLDTLVCSNLATWCPSWGKSPWLATTTTFTAAYPVTVSPWLCFNLSTMYPPFLACSCSPAMTGLSFTPLAQLVLLLLSCSLPSLHHLYKVELGNSFQRHILRMKYSNLGTMNASSIRWSMAGHAATYLMHALEHGRPCCNLLHALAHSNLVTWCPSWGKSPWLATNSLRYVLS